MLKTIGPLILLLLLLLSTNEAYRSFFDSRNCKIDKKESGDSCCCLVDQKLGVFDEQPYNSCCCKVKGNAKVAANPLYISSLKLLSLERFSNYLFLKPFSFMKKAPLIKRNDDFIHSKLFVTYTPHLFQRYCSLRI